MTSIPLSVLDLAPICANGCAADSFRNSCKLAQHVEDWGFRRFWLAEHHSMPGIASAATSLVIAHVAANTKTIRVGAGGIMLPNHSPLVIAEQFGTLATLYPGRIDLGLGRAPGSDQATAQALRRNAAASVNDFPKDVLELQGYFDASSEAPVRAVPGEGLDVPIWILGSSLFGAQLAAHLGLPYAFASHFAPAEMMSAIDLYRSQFRPSAHLDRPYLMLGYNVFAANTEAEAHLVMSSMQEAFVSLRAGRPAQLQPPCEGYEQKLHPSERQMLKSVLSCSAVGSPASVRSAMEDFVERTGADELMIASMIYDPAARLRSYEITADLLR